MKMVIVVTIVGTFTADRPLEDLLRLGILSDSRHRHTYFLDEVEVARARFRGTQVIVLIEIHRVIIIDSHRITIIIITIGFLRVMVIGSHRIIIGFHGITVEYSAQTAPTTSIEIITADLVSQGTNPPTAQILGGT